MKSKKLKATEWTQSEFIKLIFLFICFSVFFYFIFYFFVENFERKTNLINDDYSYTRGIIIKKSVYKIHTLTVKYSVKNNILVNSDAVRSNNFVVGDSVWIKYSNIKPELIIIDLNR